MDKETRSIALFPTRASFYCSVSARNERTLFDIQPIAFTQGLLTVYHLLHTSHTYSICL